jgi:SAM-dependent methyltransferase
MALPKYILRRLKDPSGLFAKLWAWLFNKSNRPENNAAVQALDLVGDESVLDLGFGGGASFPYFFDALPNGTVVGVEPAEAMIERASDNWPEEIASGRLELRSGSAADLGLPDGSIDAALTINTVYCWPDLTEGFKEIKRVLVPGGKFVVSIVDPDKLRQLGFNKVGYRLEPADTYADEFRSVGYVDIDIERLDTEKPCILVSGRTPSGDSS